MNVYVLTYANYNEAESSKASEACDELLAAPSVHETWQKAADRAKEDHDEIWLDVMGRENAEANDAPALEWEQTSDREWEASQEEWGARWRITLMEVQ